MHISKSNNIFKKIKHLGVPTNNSKKIKKNDIFFAINGEKENGNIYIEDAITKGAAAIVGDKSLNTKIIPKNILSLIVPNVRKSFGIACSNFFSNPGDNINLCGITGTNGKTSIAYLLHAIFGKEQSSLIGTIENKYGSKKIKSILTTPDTFDLNKTLKEIKNHEIKNCFLEVSSHSLELSRVEGINFDSGIFTNITRDHLDFHKNMNSYYKSKAKLFTYYLNKSKKKNKIAVINIDDKYGRKITKLINRNIKVISYSVKNSNADFYLKSIEKVKNGNKLIIKNDKNEFTLETKLFGSYNLQNILASFAISKSKGLSIKKIFDGIKKFEGAPGRLEKIKNKKINIFIDYAHTPDAIKKSIQSLKKNFNDKKIIVLFGCGGDRDKGKRARMGKIVSEAANKIIITSDNPRYESPKTIIQDIIQGISSKNINKVKVISNRGNAIRFSIKSTRKDDVLLIAGKGHEEYQEIKGIKNKFSDKREVRKCLKILK